MTSEDRGIQIDCLRCLETALEEQIANFSLDKTEDLHDEEEDDILKALWWSQGNDEWFVVMDALGYIRAASSDTPSDLLIQMHNTYAAIMQAGRDQEDDEGEL